MKNSLIHIGIDATNIRQGGGITHLSQILATLIPQEHNIEKITIWGTRNIQNNLPNLPWLEFKSNFFINFLLSKFLWQLIFLPFALRKNKCDILFSPGGILPILIDMPTVTMSQNMLPFDKKARSHFGIFSLMRIKLKFIYFLQLRSFQKANGVIYLTNYAYNAINPLIQTKKCNCIIPHGIESRFITFPKFQEPILKYNEIDRYKLLYISILMPYKHQLEVAKAISILRLNGFPVEIRFVGMSWGSYGTKFKSYINKIDPKSEFIFWDGPEKFEGINNYYKSTDAFIFASTCENLPNILIEAMASGIPIACSNRQPMTDVLGEFGFYFDPLNPEDIANTIIKMINDKDLRTKNSIASFKLIKDFTWHNCSHQTFSFISSIVNKNQSYDIQ